MIIRDEYRLDYCPCCKKPSRLKFECSISAPGIGDRYTCMDCNGKILKIAANFYSEERIEVQEESY